MMDVKSILPYHIGAMNSIFGIMILTTLTILKFEKEEKLNQSNRISLFIGIWYIQPKLNKYIKMKKSWEWINLKLNENNIRNFLFHFSQTIIKRKIQLIFS